MTKNFRLKIERHENPPTFIVRKDGKVCYMSGSQTPLALSNLVQENAAELSFALEDCFDARQAREAVQTVLDRVWRNNIKMRPIVHIL